jgi:hypothetical protein
MYREVYVPFRSARNRRRCACAARSGEHSQRRRETRIANHRLTPRAIAE